MWEENPQIGKTNAIMLGLITQSYMQGFWSGIFNQGPQRWKAGRKKPTETNWMPQNISCVGWCIIPDVLYWRLLCPNRGRKPLNYIDVIGKETESEIEDLPNMTGINTSGMTLWMGSRLRPLNDDDDETNMSCALLTWVPRPDTPFLYGQTGQGQVFILIKGNSIREIKISFGTLSRAPRQMTSSGNCLCCLHEVSGLNGWHW